MEEKIKEIISVFLRIPSEKIGPATVIDRSVMQSSILLHRMYAKLSEEGVIVEGYSEIRNFADLMQRSGSENRLADTGNILTVPAMSPVPDAESGIGIDIEEVNAMPPTHDFRKEEFYKMNFTAGEIAYCILQPEPYASFAGLFAAKEAIIKAGGAYRNGNFNAIEIDHSPEGKPVNSGFTLSISHAGGMAIAVAIPVNNSLSGRQSGIPVETPQNRGNKAGSALNWLAIAALVFSVIALVIAISHRS